MSEGETPILKNEDRTFGAGENKEGMSKLNSKKI
jgi:hypothetical protein